MLGIDDLKALVKSPASFLESRLNDPASPQSLFVSEVTPWACIAPVAVMVRSIIAGTPLVGLVLGIGSLALQTSTWLGLSLVLPAVARQFRTPMTGRQAFALATYAMLPFWAAGLMYVVPEDLFLPFWWSRLMILLATTYGLVLMRQGVIVLGASQSMRLPLIGGIAIAGVTIYSVLSVLLAIGSHLILYFLR